VIAGTVKAFNLPIEYVLYDMSYANVILYGASLPTYQSKRKNEKTHETIKADDPRNKKRVSDFINSID
jgi:hypothetical protein